VTTQTVVSARPVVLPRVNLMPPEIAEAARLHRMQQAMAGAVVVSAVLAAGLYWHAKQGMASAKDDLATAQSQNASLTTKYNALSYVEQPYTQTQAKAQMVDQAMGPQIHWSFLLDDLTTRIPNNVWLTGLTAGESISNGTLGATLGADGVTSGIGTVTFTGTAFRHDDVANWLAALANVKGFADPSFSSSNKLLIGTKGVVGFDSSTLLTTKAGS
jgi:Tfp pilus assembly protein PilN